MQIWLRSRGFISLFLSMTSEPAGNALEFKAFAEDADVFATSA